MSDGETPNNTSGTPMTGALTVSGQAPTVAIAVSAEHWQFFAFVFAALLTLARALIDERQGDEWPSWLPAAGRNSPCLSGSGYPTLCNWVVKNFMIRMLPSITSRAL